MMNASPSNETTPAELRELSGNVLSMLQTLWKRPERQKADKLIRHQFYAVLKLTNRELEKAIQSLTATPEVQDNAKPPDQAPTANFAGLASSPGSSISGTKREG